MKSKDNLVSDYIITIFCMLLRPGSIDIIDHCAIMVTLLSVENYLVVSQVYAPASFKGRLLSSMFSKWVLRILDCWLATILNLSTTG